MVLLALIGIAITSYKPNGNYTGTVNYTHFTFNGINYTFTSVAKTPPEWYRGLMNTTVTNTTFELFEFQQVSVYPFWMKNTYNALDIIWINGNTVVYMVDAKPCLSYDPNQTDCAVYNEYVPADYVIEAKPPVPSFR